MFCPIHEEEKLVVVPSHKRKPLVGIDPKIRQYSCRHCPHYYYKAPKFCKPMTRQEVVQLIMVFR